MKPDLVEQSEINKHWNNPNWVPLIPPRLASAYGLFGHDKHGQHNPDYMVPELLPGQHEFVPSSEARLLIQSMFWLERP